MDFLTLANSTQAISRLINSPKVKSLFIRSTLSYRTDLEYQHKPYLALRWWLGVVAGECSSLVKNEGCKLNRLLNWCRPLWAVESRGIFTVYNSHAIRISEKKKIIRYVRTWTQTDYIRRRPYIENINRTSERFQTCANKSDISIQYAYTYTNHLCK